MDATPAVEHVPRLAVGPGGHRPGDVEPEVRAVGDAGVLDGGGVAGQRVAVHPALVLRRVDEDAGVDALVEVGVGHHVGADVGDRVDDVDPGQAHSLHGVVDDAGDPRRRIVHVT